MAELFTDAPWLYVQSTGRLYRPDGSWCGTGYSGHGEGINNPAMQEVRNVGPIPCGLYTIGHAMDHPLLGPFAIPLIPNPFNQMFGRSHFYCHGDNAEHNASLGCIIQQRPCREELARGSKLKVIAEPVNQEEIVT